LNTNLYAQDEDEAVVNDETKPKVEKCEDKLKDCESNENNYRLSRYKDLYFIVGSPTTKIQISLKYKITSLFNLYLGYSQYMFWDLGKNSFPFRDINFNPILFYRIDFPEHTFMKAIDIDIFEHNSNGKDGDASRAWSGSSIKFYTIVKFYNWSFNWDTKFYWYYNFAMGTTNWDYREYTGFWNTRLSFINYYDSDKFIDRVSFYFACFPGGNYSQRWSKGGQEIGFKFRMGWGTFYPSILVQLYHGYNENLLDYNKEIFAYRLGIAF
jgi:phospholipase A1